jgi:hypothetical protein
MACKAKYCILTGVREGLCTAGPCRCLDNLPPGLQQEIRDRIKLLEHEVNELKVRNRMLVDLHL